MRGYLHRTKRHIVTPNAGKRTLFKDDTGQLWVKIFYFWKKFPQDVRLYKDYGEDNNRKEITNGTGRNENSYNE